MHPIYKNTDACTYIYIYTCTYIYIYIHQAVPFCDSVPIDDVIIPGWIHEAPVASNACVTIEQGNTSINVY